MRRTQSEPVDPPPLTVSPDSVCAIIAKAREFDAKDVRTEPNPASNASDDRMLSVLEDHRDDPVIEELITLIEDLNDDAQVELVALAWLGRGLGTLEEWPRLRDDAAAAHNDHSATYLLGDPLLADYLEEGLSIFGLSCEDFDRNHL